MGYLTEPICVLFLIITGDFDMTVQHQWGVLTSQFVQTFNTTNYQFKTYHGLAHSSSPQVYNIHDCMIYTVHCQHLCHDTYKIFKENLGVME